MRRRNRVPSPHEAALRLSRMVQYMNLIFEVRLGDGVWRKVRVGQHVRMSNEAKPELALFVFKLEPLIVTPYLPELRGTFFASRPGYERRVVSWAPSMDMRHLSQLDEREHGRSLKVGFRPLTPEAEDWFVLQLAKAAGMRFRNRPLLRKDRYEYTREP